MSKEEIIKKIKSFKELKFNWNGYDAEPLSTKVIEKAINLVEELNIVPEVFPTPRNSIQFEWEKDGLYLEFEIYEDRIEIFNQFDFNGKIITLDRGE